MRVKAGSGILRRGKNAMCPQGEGALHSHKMPFVDKFGVRHEEFKSYAGRPGREKALRVGYKEVECQK